MEVVQLQERKYWLVSVIDTFHGRDIFAPVAGYLSRGVDPACFGPAVSGFHRILFPEPVVTATCIEGRVIAVDRFGNLITNIERNLVQAWAGDGGMRIEAGPNLIDGMGRIYSDVGEGVALALWGSTGFLELSVNRGRADRILRLGRHDMVKVRRIR